MNQERRRLWEAVVQRDEGLCQVCGRPGSEVHHVVPRSHPFPKVWSLENMVLLCSPCHLRAHTRKARRWLLVYLARRWGYDYSQPPFREYVAPPSRVRPKASKG